MSFKCHNLSSSLWSQICPSTEQRFSFRARMSHQQLHSSASPFEPVAWCGCLFGRWCAAVPHVTGTGWLCCIRARPFLFSAGRWMRASTGVTRRASPRRTWRKQPARCQKKRKASRPWWWTTPTTEKQPSAWWLLTNLSSTPRRPKMNKQAFGVVLIDSTWTVMSGAGQAGWAEGRNKAASRTEWSIFKALVPVWVCVY